MKYKIRAHLEEEQVKELEDFIDIDSLKTEEGKIPGRWLVSEDELPEFLEKLNTLGISSVLIEEQCINTYVIISSTEKETIIKRLKEFNIIPTNIFQDEFSDKTILNFSIKYSLKNLIFNELTQLCGNFFFGQESYLVLKDASEFVT